MNRGLPSPGIGLAVPNDPRLATPSSRVMPNTTPSSSARNISSINASLDDSDEIQIIRQISSQRPIVNYNNNNNNTNDNRKGPFLKMKSRPKKNERLPAQEHEATTTPTKTTNGHTASLPEGPSSAPQVNMPVDKQNVSSKFNTAPDNKQNSSSQSSATMQPDIRKPARDYLIRPTISAPSESTKQNLPKLSSTTPDKQNIPKFSATPEKILSPKSSVTPDTNQSKHVTKSSTALPVRTPFSWDTYLSLFPAEVAPKEAFMQAIEPLTNHFKPGMKLEARDPRNPNSWCLASVVSTEGLRMRLRLDGSDNSNDFYELIDSDNIRAVRSKPGELLFPPMAYKGDVSTYAKYVDKVLSKNAIVAPSYCFIPLPKRPETNLFKEGMKLEAVDRKNPHLVCPATIGQVNGCDVKIIFDGWRGSFDYACKYYSREIFPVNWCRDTWHSIVPPNGWEGYFNKKPESVKQQNKSPSPSGASKTHKYTADEIRAMITKNVDETEKSPLKFFDTKTIGAKEVHLSKVNLVPRMTPINADSPKSKGSPTAGSSIPKNTEDLEESEDLPDEVKYKCQRIVPYDEWRKTKNAEPVQPVADSNVSEIPSPSLNTSDSTSLASTFSISTDLNVITSSQSAPSQGAPSTESRRRGRPPKKLKLDNFGISCGATPNSTTNTSIPYRDWTMRDVIEFISTDETLAKYSEVFENHEIDGKAFVLLTTDIMINHMGLKIGPILKINDLIERVKRMR